MKLIKILIIFAALSLNASAGLWKVHGAKDNTLSCSWISSPESVYGSVCLQWDMAWDQQYPDQKDSGILWDFSLVWTGYNDVLSVNVPEGWAWWGGSISGPFQGLDAEDWYPGAIYLELEGDSGEVWVDYSIDCTVRISVTQPDDFGKWAWDGSINPSWVEPLAPKNQHGKGHWK